MLTRVCIQPAPHSPAYKQVAPAEALSGPAPALRGYVELGRPADFMEPESKGGSPGVGCDYS